MMSAPLKCLPGVT